MTDLTDLIARLEGAEAGSRELDAEIAVAVRCMVSASGTPVPDWADKNFPLWRDARSGVVEVVHANGTGGLNWRAPHFTTAGYDLTAVLSHVVPEGWWLYRINQYHTGDWPAGWWGVHLRHIPPWEGGECVGESKGSLLLAANIAALKAQAAKRES